MKFLNKDYTTRQVWTAVVVVIIAVVLVAGGASVYMQDKHVNEIRKFQMANVHMSLGNGRSADAYINFVAGRSQNILDNCGTLQAKELLIGNFELTVVRAYNPLGLGKYIHIYKTYTYTMDNMTFSSTGVGHPVQGNLEAVHLDLTNYPADTIVVHQFENCQHHSSTLININPRTGKLQPFEARTINNNLGSRIIISNDSKFIPAGKDHMDSFVANPLPDPKHRHLVIHWKFDQNIGQFIETGKGLAVNKQ